MKLLARPLALLALAGLPLIASAQTGWTKIGLPAEPVTVDNPGGENRVYAVQVDPTANLLYAASRSGGLMVSADEGATWSYRRPGAGLVTFSLSTGPNPKSFRLHPANPARLYLGSELAGCFVSSDTGASWSKKNVGTNGLTFAFDPVTSTRVWYAATGGLYVSNDSGATWSLTPATGRTVTSVLVDPTNPSVIYLGAATAGEGVQKSTDGGLTWTQKNSGFRSGSAPSTYEYAAVFHLVMDPTDSSVLYAVTVDGLYQTTNGGDTWAKTTPFFDPPVGDPTGMSQLFSLFIHPQTPDVMIGGTKSGRLYKTSDAGETWLDITGTVPVQPDYPVTDIQADPRDLTTLYAATWKGLFRATLYGVGPAGGTPSTQNFEAETTTRAGVGASLSIQSDTGASGGQRVTLDADGDGDHVNYFPSATASGTYTLKIYYKKLTAGGIAQLRVNDQNVGATFDTYASTTAFANLSFPGVSLPAIGKHLVRLSVAGKNASSSGRKISIDRIELVPETPALPAAPSALSATAASSSQINLAWTDNSTNETGFKIERSANGSSGWTQITTTAASATTSSDTGLAASTTYYYRVRATNAAGDSAYTAVASATTSSALTPQSFEAETLSRTSSGATTQVDTDAGASGGQRVTLNSGAIGQSVTYTAAVAAPGAYDVTVTYKKLTAGGTAQFSVNGVNHGSPINMYAGTAAFASTTFTAVPLTASSTFTFTVTGKAASATGYKISIDKIDLAP